jgi:hypothetical protein
VWVLVHRQYLISEHRHSRAGRNPDSFSVKNRKLASQQQKLMMTQSGHFS